MLLLSLSGHVARETSRTAALNAEGTSFRHLSTQDLHLKDGEDQRCLDVTGPPVNMSDFTTDESSSPACLRASKLHAKPSFRTIANTAMLREAMNQFSSLRVQVSWLYLAQLSLEASELAFPSDVLIVESVQLGPSQQMLPLQQGDDDAVRQLLRLLGKGVFLAIDGQQGVVGQANSACGVWPKQATRNMCCYQWPGGHLCIEETTKKKRCSHRKTAGLEHSECAHSGICMRFLFLQQSLSTAKHFC